MNIARQRERERERTSFLTLASDTFPSLQQLLFMVVPAFRSINLTAPFFGKSRRGAQPRGSLPSFLLSGKLSAVGAGPHSRMSCQPTRGDVPKSTSNSAGVIPRWGNSLFGPFLARGRIARETPPHPMQTGTLEPSNTSCGLQSAALPRRANEAAAAPWASGQVARSEDRSHAPATHLSWGVAGKAERTGATLGYRRPPPSCLVLERTRRERGEKRACVLVCVRVRG